MKFNASAQMTKYDRCFHRARMSMELVLVFLCFAVVADAFQIPFTASLRKAPEEQADNDLYKDGSALLRADSISMPTGEALNGIANPNSWCAKAARAAETKCNLLFETERMQMATLVANCHLETMKRPPVIWDPNNRLRDASEEHQTLVVVVASQLEKHCSAFGVSWSHASATEIQMHLSKLRSVAEQIVTSTTESVDTAEKIESLSTKLEEMQSATLKNAESFQALSAEVSQQLELVGKTEQKATEMYLASEERFREFGKGLTQSVASLPEAADTFLKNSERFEALLQEQSRLADLHAAPATTTSILIAAFILSVGFLYSGRPFFLLISSLILSALKGLAETEKIHARGRSAFFFLDPFSLIAGATFFLLSLIPYQALVLSASMAVGWVFSPDALQKSFLGDRSILASARFEAAEAKACALELNTKLQKHEETIVALKEEQEKAALTNSQQEKKIKTKDNCIQTLEKKVRDNSNLHRDIKIQHEQLRNEVEEQKHRARRCKAQMLEFGKENEKLKAKSENFDRNMADKVKEIEKQRESLAASEQQRKEEKTRQFRNASTALRAELETIQAEVAELKTQNLALNGKVQENVLTLRECEATVKGKDAKLLQMAHTEGEMTAELEMKDQELKGKNAELKQKLVELTELQNRDVELEDAGASEKYQQAVLDLEDRAEVLTRELRQAREEAEVARMNAEDAWAEVKETNEAWEDAKEEFEEEIEEEKAMRREIGENAALELSESHDEVAALRKKVHELETLKISSTQDLSQELLERRRETEKLRKRLLHLEEKESSAALELANLKRRQELSKAAPQSAVRSMSFTRSGKHVQKSAPYVSRRESSDDEAESGSGAGAETGNASATDGDETAQHSLDTPPARASRGSDGAGRSHATAAADNEYRSKLRSQTPHKRG